MSELAKRINALCPYPANAATGVTTAVVFDDEEGELSGDEGCEELPPTQEVNAVPPTNAAVIGPVDQAYVPTQFLDPPTEYTAAMFPGCGVVEETARDDEDATVPQPNRVYTPEDIVASRKASKRDGTTRRTDYFGRTKRRSVTQLEIVLKTLFDITDYPKGNKKVTRVVNHEMDIWYAAELTAGRKVSIHTHMQQLLEWKARNDAHKLRNAAKRARECTVTQAFSPIETALLAIVKGTREVGGHIDYAYLKQKAGEFAELYEVGKSVSDHYIACFMSRNRLRKKVVKRQSELSSADVRIRAQKLHEHLYRMVPHFSLVCNMDEIPMSLSGTMGRLYTITSVDDKTVRLNMDAKDTKRCCSVIPIMGVLKSGDAWSKVHVGTIVLLIGTPKSPAVRSESYDPRVKVVWQEHGVMNENIMVTVVVPFIAKRAAELNAKCLVILDSARSHTTENVARAFHASGMASSVIAGGMTSYIQWIDTCYAAKYRVHHAHHYRILRTKGMTARDKRSRLIEVVAEAISDSYKEMDVVEQFEKLGYTDPEACNFHTLRAVEYVFRAPEGVNRAADAKLLTDKQERARAMIKDAIDKRVPRAQHVQHMEGMRSFLVKMTNSTPARVAQSHMSTPDTIAQATPLPVPATPTPTATQGLGLVDLTQDVIHTAVDSDDDCTGTLDMS